MTSLHLQKIPLPWLSSDDPEVCAQVARAIENAFGPGGPGLLLIDQLGETYARDRQRLLRAGHALGTLTPAQLSNLEFPEVDYSVGWSRGREIFKGVPDSRKGSFYANPVHDDPALGDESLAHKYPHSMHKNCWPSQTGCEETEDAFKKIGHLISDIGILIAHHCDLFVRARLANGSKFSSIERTLRNSRAAKGRLLHYYPPDGDSVSSGGQDVDEMWCGYHNDHGTLTGLISGAFFRSGKAEVIEKSPDSSAGLYVVRSEGARAEKASIPSDCLAFQIGESAQIATGGLLRATPHAVRMPSSAIDVSRVTLAVFLQPNPWDILRLPGKDECKVKSVLQTHSLVPPLSARYEDNQSFHDFTAETFKAYYD